MVLSRVGYFYMIHLLPQSQPGTVKLGYTTAPTRRFSQHQRMYPEALLVKQWHCLPEWEYPAIRYIAEGYTPIEREVFINCELNRMIERAEQFFAEAPTIDGEAPIERQQISIYLPPDLRLWLKVHAIEQGRDMSEIIEELVQEYRAKRG